MPSAPAQSICICANAPVFDLPILVALERDMFRSAGIDVRYLRGPASPNAPSYTIEGANTYNLCAWSGFGQIDTVGESSRITALRPAIVAQAIVSFDDTLYNPHDLAKVPIGVNLYHASHFATRQLVSGSLPPGSIRIEAAGPPDQRLHRLLTGELRAVTLMEPHLTLALEAGAHIVALTFYRGADVMSDAISDDQADAYYDVINDAVDEIRRDFGRYSHFVVAPLGSRLASDALDTRFVRYNHAETYDPARAHRVAPWAEAWASSDDHCH